MTRALVAGNGLGGVDTEGGVVVEGVVFGGPVVDDLVAGLGQVGLQESD